MLSDLLAVEAIPIASELVSKIKMNSKSYFLLVKLSQKSRLIGRR